MVVNAAEEYLLLRRSDNDLWCYPGGSCEIGESFANAAISELYEESGIRKKEEDLVPFACVSSPEFNITHYSNGDVAHFFNMVYYVHWDNEPILIDDESVDWRFFKKGDFPDALMNGVAIKVDLLENFQASGKFQNY